VHYPADEIKSKQPEEDLKMSNELKEIAPVIDEKMARKLAKIKDDETRINRAAALYANAGLVRTNTEEMAKYFDNKGKGPSGFGKVNKKTGKAICVGKGLLIQINKEIKKCFEFTVNDDNTEDRSRAIAQVRSTVNGVMKKGIADRVDREMIKKTIYQVISIQAEAFKLTAEMQRTGMIKKIDD